MIVYNAGRRWFPKKEDADKYCLSLGLKPSATLKIDVQGRDDLAALLNALCDPPGVGQPVPAPATVELVDRAFVAGSTDIPDCVPDFLLKDWGLKR